MRFSLFVKVLVATFAFVVVTGRTAAAPPEQQVTQVHIMKLIPTKDLCLTSFFHAPSPIQGLHTPRGQTHLLQINEALERDAHHVARTVCAHEMGHALGLDHGTDKNGWMFPHCNADSPVINWPSAAELEAAKRGTVNKVFRLIVDAPDNPAIARAARWAAETWNCALERDVIQVVR